MTIKRKNIRPGGLLEAEADPTDIVNTNGFSDIINTIGAKTAKFSGGGIMQANAGLRIGLTQLKISSGPGAVPRSRNLESNSVWGNPNNAFDGNPASDAATGSIGSPLIIDFTSIATEILKFAHGTTSANSLLNIKISDDNVIYTDLGNFNTTFTGSTGQEVDLGIQTWRYVAIERISGTASSRLFEVFEVLITDSAIVRVRSSITQDTTDGTVLITDQLINSNETLTFNTDLLLIGDSQFVTLEIVSFSAINIDVKLLEITSITEA